MNNPDGDSVGEAADDSEGELDGYLVGHSNEKIKRHIIGYRLQVEMNP